MGLPIVKSVATLALGISFCGAAGYFFYLYFQSTKDDDYEETVLPAFLRKNHERHEMQIPRSAARAVIGRNGSHIREIEHKSQTKINFKDQGKDENFRVCVITGPKENCHVAIGLIEEFLAFQPVIESEEIWVPRPTVGRIIGRNGDKIAHISHMSGAKIRVTQGERQNTDERQLLITGTLDQIERARTAILDIVVKDIEMRKKLDWKLAQREPRGKPLPESKKQHPLRKSYEKLTSAGDGQMEVYLSAVNDPSQFWVQIVGPKANELDQLVEEMTEYYTKAENRQEHKVKSPAVGDIVVAAFMYDGKFYRCEITQLNTGDNQQCVELYFLDYGDKCDVPIKEIYGMRTDFLQLRFQAIECFLAQVKPAHNNKWSDEATDRFEEWTQVAQWKKLRARVSEYQDVDPDRFNYRARRATSPIPGVDLYDVNNQEDIDIAMELVKHGYAKWKFVPTFPGGAGEIMDDIEVSQEATEDTKETIDNNTTVTSDNDVTSIDNKDTINTTEIKDIKETIDIVPATINTTETKETIDIVPATTNTTELKDNKEIIDIVPATINTTETKDNKETIDIVPAAINNTEIKDNKEAIDIVPATINTTETKDNKETIDIVPAAINNTEIKDNKETIDMFALTNENTEIKDNKQIVDILALSYDTEEIKDIKETIDIVAATINNTEPSDHKDTLDFAAVTHDNDEKTDNKGTIDIGAIGDDNEEIKDIKETIDIVAAPVHDTEPTDHKKTIDFIVVEHDNGEKTDNKETTNIGAVLNEIEEVKVNQQPIDIVAATIHNTEPVDHEETIDFIEEISDNKESTDIGAVRNDNDEIKLNKEMVQNDNEEFINNKPRLDISFNDNATTVTNGNKEEVHVIEEDSNGNAKFSEFTERN